MFNQINLLFYFGGFDDNEQNKLMPILHQMYVEISVNIGHFWPLFLIELDPNFKMFSR